MRKTQLNRLDSELKKTFNPLHPKFPAERQAVPGRKNMVRLRSTPLPLHSLPGGQAWWGGRWMNSMRDSAANDIIHKWPHPQKVGTKLTLGPFSLPHLLDLHKRRGLPRAWHVGLLPLRPSGGGGCQGGAQLGLIFRGARERRGQRPPSISRMKGGTPHLQDPPEFHVLEQGRTEKGPHFSVCVCKLAICHMKAF